MKKRFIALLALVSVAFTSCETGASTETNTERFYASAWNVDIERSHPEVGAVPAAEELHSCVAELSKNGSFYMPVDSLRHHSNQHWGYSWSTDHFYMNWSPCIEWHINEASDSMYLYYQYEDYDANTGVNFYWDYKLYMTK